MKGRTDRSDYENNRSSKSLVGCCSLFLPSPTNSTVSHRIIFRRCRISSCHTQADAAPVFHSTVSPISSKFCYCLTYRGHIFTHFEMDFPLTSVSTRTVKTTGCVSTWLSHLQSTLRSFPHVSLSWAFFKLMCIGVYTNGQDSVVAIVYTLWCARKPFWIPARSKNISPV